MLSILSFLVVIPLVLFWLWMFRAMLSNVRIPDTPSGPMRWPPSSKFEWTVAFIFLNVLTAGYHYLAEYKV